MSPNFSDCFSIRHPVLSQHKHNLQVRKTCQFIKLAIWYYGQVVIIKIESLKIRHTRERSISYKLQQVVV